MRDLAPIYRTHKNISSGLEEAYLNKSKLYQVTIDVVGTVVSSSGTCFVGDFGIPPGQRLDYSSLPNVFVVQGGPYGSKSYGGWIFLEGVPTFSEIYLSHAPDRIDSFESSWNQLVEPSKLRILPKSEISSDNTLPTMKYALSKEKYNLLLRIRAFRKKVGKININVCDLLREARKHA